MTAYQRFFKKVAKGRPAVKKEGRQSVLVTRKPLLDPQTAVLRLGTKKHPVGDIAVNVHPDYTVPNSMCISVHGGKWQVSFSNEDDSKPVATEAKASGRTATANQKHSFSKPAPVSIGTWSSR